MVVLELELVAVVLPDPEVDPASWFGFCGGVIAPDAHRPVVPVELRRAAPRVAARVGGEVPRRVGHERHVEERLARVPGDRVPVEDVEDREVADGEDQAPAVDDGRELHRVRRLLDAAAAEVERLPQVGARPVELRRLGAGLLQLEVLDRAADPRSCDSGRSAITSGTKYASPPRQSRTPEEQREAAGEAPLGVRHERVGAAVRVRVRRVERELPARDVGELPVRVPALVLGCRAGRGAPAGS